MTLTQEERHDELCKMAGELEACLYSEYIKNDKERILRAKETMKKYYAKLEWPFN